MRTARTTALLCVGVSVVLFAPGSAWAQPRGFDGHQVVKITAADEAQLEVLRALDAASRDIEIWSEVLHVGVIEARVSPEQKRKLDASGLKYTVHIEDLQAHIDEMYADRGGGFCDQYRTYDEHIAFLNELAAQYPTLAQTVDLGQSVEGRTLLALRITGPGDQKVGLLYHGAQHGDEQAGAMLVAYTANHLLTNYATDPAVRALVDNAEWYLLPIMNPDGYERYRRYNARWIDLNRNWGGPGSGEDSSGGPYPFSEPETSALRDFLVGHPNVRLHLDLHGYVPWFMWSWGFTSEHAPDHGVYYPVGVEVRSLIRAAGGESYHIGSIWEVAYWVSGGSIDYSYGDLNRWGFTLELDDYSIPAIYNHYLSTLFYLASWVSDCNANGIPDFDEITGGSTADCNDNGVPDECDLAGGISFETPVSYATGVGPYSVAMGDLDDNDHVDLAVANLSGDSLSVLLNQTDGTFAAAVSYAVGDRPHSVAIGDLDQNSYEDLAVANLFTDDVSVLLNHGDGTFAAAVSYAVGDSPHSVAIGDLDRDGHEDLAVGSFNSEDVTVLLNHGDGTFAAGLSYAAGGGPYSVAIGDLDHDGYGDVAVANYVTDDVSVLLNHGDGTLAVAVSYAAGDAPSSVAIGDLNHDGHDDLVVANLFGDDVSVLMNCGDGTFAAAVSYAVGDGPYSLAIGDLNHDGRDDLAIANQESDNVAVLLNRGDGTFAAAVSYAAGDDPHSVAVGDLNHDHNDDLAVADYGSDAVSVLISNGAAYSLDCNLDTIPDECESFEACDFGGDGDVDLHDWAAFVGCLAGPGVGPEPAVARCGEACLAAFDLDYDGDVDLVDAAGFQELHTGGARPLCWVEASVPGDGWIDARQPIDNPVEQNPAGWREVEIIFDSECEAGLIEASDFSISEGCEPGECDDVGPGIASFAGAGYVGTLTLDRPIDPKAWTVITFHGEYADDVIRLGYLPADVDGSLVAGANDIVEVVEGVQGGGALHQYDVDRSGSLTAADLTVLVDLLNGAEPFEGYRDKRLPPLP